MICSSVNRLRFIRPSPSRVADSTYTWRSFRGSGQPRSWLTSADEEKRPSPGAVFPWTTFHACPFILIKPPHSPTPSLLPALPPIHRQSVPPVPASRLHAPEVFRPLFMADMGRPYRTPSHPSLLPWRGGRILRGSRAGRRRRVPRR